MLKWLQSVTEPWSQAVKDSILWDAGWSDALDAWALAQGCDWGKWKCLKLAAKRYYDVDRREQAQELLAWAHNNGCPCTCDKAAAAAAATLAAGADAIAVD
eukprot:17912-Heterococcus_DN1.PRE.1